VFLVKLLAVALEQQEKEISYKVCLAEWAPARVNGLEHSMRIVRSLELNPNNSKSILNQSLELEKLRFAEPFKTTEEVPVRI
jgi:hypothetical protein